MAAFLDVSEFDYRTAAGMRLEGAGVKPDEVSPLSRADIYSRRDRALELARDSLRISYDAHDIMLYLSQVLGRPIRDLEGERVATIKDIIVRLGADDHPPVTGLVARYRRRDFFLSRWRITELNQNGVRLNSDILDLRPFVRRENEVLLARTCSTNN